MGIFSSNFRYHSYQSHRDDDAFNAEIYIIGLHDSSSFMRWPDKGYEENLIPEQCKDIIVRVLHLGEAVEVTIISSFYITVQAQAAAKEATPTATPRPLRYIDFLPTLRDRPAILFDSNRSSSFALRFKRSNSISLSCS